MGRKGNWFSSLKKALSSDPKEQKDSMRNQSSPKRNGSKAKAKSFGFKPHRNCSRTFSFSTSPAGLIDERNEETKHVMTYAVRKRVNYACRSVISPDPYLAVNEIGIPPYFALRLTYPERVTPWNIVKMRKAVINGPENHPGATHYIDRQSTLKLPTAKKQRISISRKLTSSKGVSAQAFKNSELEYEGKVVYRHLSDGDIVLVNRQDHIVSSSLLTKKDTFLRFDEFNQLFYSSGICTSRSISLSGPRKKVIVTSEDNIVYPVPAIVKPEPLWTGKQVITAVLNHLTKGSPPFTMEKQGKVPSDFFKRWATMDKSSGEDGVKNLEPGEDTVYIFKNYLVSGVIDKAQFGDYGLVHTVQELYGSHAAGTLLSTFSRLFTSYLQTHGFTCGVDDLLLKTDNDTRRKQQLEECEGCGEEVHRNVVGLRKEEFINPLDLQMRIEEIIRSNGEAALTNLDRRMISKLNELSSNKIEKDLLSEGLLKLTGKNWISLMTTSGAKGGTANFQQISSHLGQQELEGKRVPRMVSGKTLPSFPPWDWASRAGGFIIDRFLLYYYLL